jgi:hypothetical protein
LNPQELAVSKFVVETYFREKLQCISTTTTTTTTTTTKSNKIKNEKTIACVFYGIDVLYTNSVP